MHRHRPQAAIAAVIASLSLVSMAALALAWVQNIEPGADDGIARMGIEGEGDLPLPVAEQA